VVQACQLEKLAVNSSSEAEKQNKQIYSQEASLTSSLKIEQGVTIIAILGHQNFLRPSLDEL
jgi:hypothetical protein